MPVIYCTDALGGATDLYLGEGVNLLFEGHNLYWSRPDGEITALFLGEEREFTRDDDLDGNQRPQSAANDIGAFENK